MASQPEWKDEFQAQKALSKGGNDYESGSRRSQTDTKTVTAVSHGSPFNRSVDWPVDDKWHNTSDDFAAETGITSYIVGNSSNPIFDYYIQFITNQDYDYFFTDESPDTYENNVSDTSEDHITRYNSDKPTIKFVTGK